MDYVRQAWQDDTPSLPLSAARMNHLEDALVDYSSRLAYVSLADKPNRPDGSGPGTADTGQAWNQLTGTINVTSNELITPSTPTTSQAVVDAGSSDIYFRGWIRHLGGAPSLLIRCSNDLLNRLTATLDAGAGDVRIQKVVAGGALTPITPTGRPVTWVVDGSRSYFVEFLAIGRDVACWVDGVFAAGAVLSDTDLTAFSGLTRVGIRTTSAGAAFHGLVADRPRLPGDNAPIKSVAGPYTVIAGDAGKVLLCSGGAITVPVGALAPGDAVYVAQSTATAVTITNGTGMTVQNAGTVGGQYKIATLTAVSATEVWQQ